MCADLFGSVKPSSENLSWLHNAEVALKIFHSVNKIHIQYCCHRNEINAVHKINISIFTLDTCNILNA